MAALPNKDDNKQRLQWKRKTKDYLEKRFGERYMNSRF